MTETRLHSAADPVLSRILAASGWDDANTDALALHGDGDVIPTKFPIEAMGAAVLSAVGLAVDRIWQLRGGAAQKIAVDRRAAGLAMSSSDYLLVDGTGIKTWDPVTGFYRDRDGRWVYLHGNFPHLRDGVLDMLGASNDADAVREAVAGWSASDLETAAIERGLCASVVRTRGEWCDHPQHKAVSVVPLLSIERIGDAPPMPPAAAARPLSGVRVVDCARVIAGPMAGRTFAEHGADVLRINGPHLPHIESLVIDTGLGKRSCHLDLRERDGVARLETLVRGADVFVDAYRPGSLAARGFGADDLHRLRPGIVSVSLTAWSSAGPWAARRGYDSLVQAACGMTPVGEGGTPVRMPAAPLDYLSGYLAAFGAMVALARRAEEGGSWRVELSLLRTAEWIFETAEAIGLKSSPPASMPLPGDIPGLYQDRDSVFGALAYLAPALSMSETPPRWDRPPVPPGTDDPAWT